jgi:peptidoglycan/xylan/chitin deacetylase (PgdA/CDA1 family)
VEELARRGLPATIFVAPAFVGGHSFWWDALMDRGASGRAFVEFRETVLELYRGEDQRIRAHAFEHGLIEEVPVGEMLVATEPELRTAAEIPGITFGSHSWSHPNLAALSLEELRHELTAPLHWLRERFDNVVPWLSYPYGLSTKLVEEATEAAGYLAALRVSGGWLPREPISRYGLPRLNVPSGLSGNGFALRTAGLFAGRVA